MRTQTIGKNEQSINLQTEDRKQSRKHSAKPSLRVREMVVVFAVAVIFAMSGMAQDTVVSGANGTYYNPLQIALKAWYNANNVAAFQGAPYNFNSPGGITFDGSNVWIANGGGGTVSKIRASDGRLLGTFAAGSDPAALAFDGRRIWVANHNLASAHTTVTVLNASDGTPAFAATVGSNPNGMAWFGWAMYIGSNDGWAYVIDNWGGLVCKRQLTTTSRLYDVAFDGSSMWFTAIDDDSVIEVKTDNKCTVGTTIKLSSNSGPVGIAYDGTNLWTANCGGNGCPGNAVAKIEPPFSTQKVRYYSVGSGPWSLAFDGANIWVVNYNGGTVTKLLAKDGSVTGTFLPCVTDGSAKKPQGIAFDAANMWVTCPSSNAVGKM